MLAMRSRQPATRVVGGTGGRRLARIDTDEFTPWPEGGLLVGGAVRDALLGRAATDLDWLVPDPRIAARSLAAALEGAVFPLDEDRGHWRVVVTGERRMVHDFVPYKGHEGDEKSVRRTGGDAVTRDLERRDLTINAIGLRRSGELVDPTGGIADLKAGLVRMTSEASLRADPVRPLRAARFAGQLGFELADETGTAVRESAAAQLEGRARRPAPERVRDELLSIIGSDVPSRTFSLAADLGLLATFLPELDATRGVAQGPLHHLDVFGHSLEALQRLCSAFPEAGAALRLATLLHDIGKPPSSGTHWTGRPTFHGHDRLGAELTARALRRLRFSSDVVAEASGLVRRHMTPLPGSEKGARRFVHRQRGFLPDLLRLMIADREAARGRRASEAGRRSYRLALARIIAILDESPPPARLLDGDEVMALLGLDPGPRVGEALALLDEAVAVGDVSDREGAEAYLRHYARAQGWA